MDERMLSFDDRYRFQFDRFFTDTNMMTYVKMEMFFQKIGICFGFGRNSRVLNHEYRVSSIEHPPNFIPPKFCKMLKNEKYRRSFASAKQTCDNEQFLLFLSMKCTFVQHYDSI